MALCKYCDQDNANQRMTTILSFEESETGNV